MDERISSGEAARRNCQRLQKLRTARVARWPLLSALLVVSLAAPSGLAAAPRLRSHSPVGAKRGAEVEFTFTGSDLADAQEIMLYYPGIAVTRLEAVNETTVKTKFLIAPDCRPGIHAMRLRSATGISNLRTFSVGALPEVAEVEPNSDFSTPQKIELDTTVNGLIENEDADYYLVEARQGERITAEIEGIRLGNAFFDPCLAILDANRFELATCDDAALVWQDAVISLIAPADGNYIVQVRESAFGGNAACSYRLHVGRFPRPTAAFPAGGKSGEAMKLHWLGDVLGEREDQIVVPVAIAPESLKAEPFGLFARDDRGQAPSPNAFVISDLGNVLEAEPNEDASNATSFTAPMALNGIISQSGDVDCFKFDAKKGQALDIRVLARTIRSPLDPVMTVRRLSGAGVGSNDDSGGPDAYLRFSAPADDTYVVSVKDHLGRGGVDYVYRVELNPVEPKLVMGLPERRQYFDTTAAVPQGNRTAIMVSAQRRDFGGELAIEMQGLPEGVTIETTPMRANQTAVPVLLSAGPGTPLSGALVDVIGRTTDPKQNVIGHLQQVTGLARGQNQILVWGHTAHRMAAAVTAEAPFTLEIVEPKAPLVRNGSMELKVIAKRKEGFTAPIGLRMLYNPPGVASSGEISIPEGQNEALIPLTANGGAEINAFKIAVLGDPIPPENGQGPGQGQGGRRRRRGTGLAVSSQLATLQVAEPFLKFDFNAAAVEQGKETEFVVKVAANKPFDGEASVELAGLPFEATAEPLKLTKDTTELAFKLKTTGKSPVGRHKTLLCKATVTAEGEPVVHMLGTGELRIDAPLAPKPNAAAANPGVAQAPPAEKRLTRLEQLRQEREQLLKAAQDKTSGQ